MFRYHWFKSAPVSARAIDDNRAERGAGGRAGVRVISKGSGSSVRRRSVSKSMSRNTFMSRGVFVCTVEELSAICVATSGSRDAVAPEPLRGSNMRAL